MPVSSPFRREDHANGALISYEIRRGCGFRKLGGIYLVADPEEWGGSDLVPIDVETCPICGHGLRTARGLTYFDAAGYWGEYHNRRGQALLDVLNASKDQTSALARSLRSAVDYSPDDAQSLDARHAGLLWVGEKFYKSPEMFSKEAISLGISRRVPKIPRGFKVGETIICLAHGKAKATPCECVDPVIGPDEDCPICGAEGTIFTPQIFGAFVPKRLEMIVSGDMLPEDVQKLKDRGITPIVVVPVDKDGNELDNSDDDVGDE